jgi:hypothetical protein
MQRRLSSQLQILSQERQLDLGPFSLDRLHEFQEFIEHHRPQRMPNGRNSRDFIQDWLTAQRNNTIGEITYREGMANSLSTPFTLTVNGLMNLFCIGQLMFGEKNNQATVAAISGLLWGIPCLSINSYLYYRSIRRLPRLRRDLEGLQLAQAKFDKNPFMGTPPSSNRFNITPGISPAS